MINKLTLIVDTNWLFLSRLYFSKKWLRVDNSPEAKKVGSELIINTMARSIRRILGVFPQVDNIVFVEDGGSWRNTIHPSPGKEYKGNRSKDPGTDWAVAFGTLNHFLQICRSRGFTVSQAPGAEGDDWVWYWSNRLLNSGTDCMIWTADCDLRQCLNTKGNHFVCWYNDGAGLYLPTKCKCPDDPMEYFMAPQMANANLDALRRYPNTFYESPDETVIKKVLSGDSGDNISPIVSYTKGTRNYGFSNGDREKLRAKLNIRGLDDLWSNRDNIATWITKQKKFIPYKFTNKTINEQFDINKKLVWLSEETIPQEVRDRMNTGERSEYRIGPTVEVRSDYKLLTDENNEVEDIYYRIGYEEPK